MRTAWRTHSTTRCQACVVHRAAQETKGAEVEFDGGLVVVLKLAMDPDGNSLLVYTVREGRLKSRLQGRENNYNPLRSL